LEPWEEEQDQELEIDHRQISLLCSVEIDQVVLQVELHQIWQLCLVQWEANLEQTHKEQEELALHQIYLQCLVLWVLQDQVERVQVSLDNHNNLTLETFCKMLIKF
jgi:CTP synthase (UTP-ammonia lyase)